MAKFSNGLRVHMLITGSFMAAFSNARLRIYAAAEIPATADAAVTGTLLVELSKNGAGTALEFATPITTPVLNKAADSDWSTLANLASGTAAYFRLVDTADDGAASATAKRVQGTAGNAGEIDMFLADPEFVEDDPYVLEFFRIALPTL